MREKESESESVATGRPAAPLSDLVGPATLYCGGHGELGPHVEVDDDAAPEQLDWGSIHDEDGAFGQFVAASGQSEDGELDLEGRADAEGGKGWSGAGSMDLLAQGTSASSELEEGELNFGDRAEASRVLGAP